MSTPHPPLHTPHPSKLAETYGEGKFGLSFELFPPKTDRGEEAMYRHVDTLIQFAPSFITCTYGAGGSTHGKTLEIVSKVKQKHQLPVASHLTCVGATIEQLRDFLTEARECGIDSIVALRGDPPQGQANFQPVAGGLQYANELVELIRNEFPEFGIAVAGYPEMHQEAASPAVDLDNLKRKVETGADAVITQLFYNNQDFLEFRQRYEQAGIQVPLVPGVLPVTSLSQIQRITSLCGAKLPESFVQRLSEHELDADWQFKVGVEFATAQVQELIDAGAPGVHFYVLNKSQATAALLQAVQLPGSESRTV